MPVTRPALSSHIGTLNGLVAYMAPDELNRGVTMLNFMIWPVLLVAAARPSTIRSTLQGRMLAAAVILLTLFTTFYSAHETSKVALLFAGAIYALYAYAPKIARGLVVGGWVTATVLIVPLVERAYQSNLHLTHWIPENGRARLIIWAATAEQFHRHPVLGIGADNTSVLDEMNTAAVLRPGHVYPWRTGMHAHNIYLQTWYELGLVGAMLLLAIGLVILRWISVLPDVSQRFMLATFVSAAVIGAFGFGMWQLWLVAGYFLSTTLALLAIKYSQLQLRA